MKTKLTKEKKYLLEGKEENEKSNKKSKNKCTRRDCKGCSCDSDNTV